MDWCMGSPYKEYIVVIQGKLREHWWAHVDVWCAKMSIIQWKNGKLALSSLDFLSRLKLLNIWWLHQAKIYHKSRRSFLYYFLKVECYSYYWLMEDVSHVKTLSWMIFFSSLKSYSCLQTCRIFDTLCTANEVLFQLIHELSIPSIIQEFMISTEVMLSQCR